ncbi:hypothetical protein OAO16_00520 [Opitutales bacterium]|nr:hypothetical protein [Opitutales bacterium]
MLGFIRCPTRFRRRTAHRKGARLHPEHFQLNAIIQISGVLPDKLETNTKANVAVIAVIGVTSAAPSRTHVRPVVKPGTTPYDPIRARCRFGWIDQRVAHWITLLRPVVRGPLPHISMHIKKTPRVGCIQTYNRFLLANCPIGSGGILSHSTVIQVFVP